MLKLKTTMSTFALVTGHVAGLIDLAVLPVWVNTLIEGYRYGPAQAGSLPTGFLAGAVVTSLILSRRFHAINGRLLAPAGYWIAAFAFLLMPSFQSFPVHLLLHVIAGTAAGMSVSFIHGTIGKTDNPHRAFSYAGMGFGVFTVIFLSGVPKLIAASGPQAFFYILGGVMLIAAIVVSLFMPSNIAGMEVLGQGKRFPRAVRFAIFGMMGMALVQGMVFSFLVQAGAARGFSEQNVQTVLIVLGFINLFPPVIAAALQHRVHAMTMAMVGPILQGVFAMAIMSSTAFIGYAIPAVFFAAVMIFTHTFVFGFMAKEEPTGRAVAATPAILMTGSAISPFIGGVFVQYIGFEAIGVAAIVVGGVCVVMFTRANRIATSVLARFPASPQPPTGDSRGIQP